MVEFFSGGYVPYCQVDETPSEANDVTECCGQLTVAVRVREIQLYELSVGRVAKERQLLECQVELCRHEVSALVQQMSSGSLVEEASVGDPGGTHR